MLPKIDGARRINYKGDERYIMVKSHAKCVVPHAFDIDDIESYPDDSIIIIDKSNRLKYGICASSDGFEDNKFEITATFDDISKCNDISNTQKTWKPYSFSPILVAISDMVLNSSDIADDDYIKFSNKAKKTLKNLLEFFVVSSVAHDYLHMSVVLKILYNGISGYSEAKDDTYYETRLFSEWGTGEEGEGVLDGQSKSCGQKPSCVEFFHKSNIYLLRAMENPDWNDVPYIKLIAENGELPV